jgi:hypothetical protein
MNEYDRLFETIEELHVGSTIGELYRLKHELERVLDQVRDLIDRLEREEAAANLRLPL